MTDDGVRLRCRINSHTGGGRAMVVVVHGFAGRCDQPEMLALADRLFAAGLDVATYDARGHGGSTGRCGVGSTEHRDVASLVSHLTSGGIPVVLVGISMGGVAVVAHLARIDAADEGVIGAVLVSAPARWRMRPSALGLLNAFLTRTAPGRWAAGRFIGVRVSPKWRLGENPESAMARIRVPVAVVHGSGDRLLDPSHALLLHRAGSHDRLLHLVEGMGHGLDPQGTVAVEDAVEWVLDGGRLSPTTMTTR